jgi:hypothetical protein
MDTLYDYNDYSTDARRRLSPLLSHLAQYDQARRRLEQEGGTGDDLSYLTILLNRKIELGRGRERFQASLTESNALRQAIREAVGYDWRLQVRLLPSSRMPVYYLCRTCSDYWSTYRLVVEDVYHSPGYSFADPRFCRLMSRQKEMYHLRLSPFRETARCELALEADWDDWRLDDALVELGRHVFQAAWHEDQTLAILSAQHFGMPSLRDAIELLYLCLSGDLCDLRRVANPQMRAFFTKVYPQPAINELLALLPHLDGRLLSELPAKALKLYSRMGAEFARFLGVELDWKGSRVALHRLIFANLSHLDCVSRRLRNQPAAQDAAARLDTSARDAITTLTGGEDYAHMPRPARSA